MKKKFTALTLVISAAILLSACYLEDVDELRAKAGEAELKPGTSVGPYIVTFDKNHSDAIGFTLANPPTKTVVPPAIVINPPLPTPPTREGHIFAGWNLKADGSGAGFTMSTAVTSSFTVYAQWKESFVVTFLSNNYDKGSTDAIPRTIEVPAPATTVGTLPVEPNRIGFRFVGWNLLASGGGAATEFTATTLVTDSFSVYAQWEFVGGTPYIDGTTVVHNMPLIEVTAPAVLNADGSVTFTGGGTLKYKFPTKEDFPSLGNDFDILDYDYFIISRTATPVEGINPAFVMIQYDGGVYTGAGNNYPWATNPDWLRKDISGAGGSGGFGLQDSSSKFTIKFNSIVFYIQPSNLTPINTEKYRIQSWYDGSTGPGKNFLRDNGHGILELGEAFETGTDAWNWIVLENPAGQRTIKNVETGNFINVKGLTPGWNVNVLCSPFNDDPGFYWDFDMVDPVGGLGAYHLLNAGVPMCHTSEYIYRVQWRDDMQYAITDNWGDFIFAFWPLE